MLSRVDDYLVIPIMWWNDPEKAAEYEDAKKNTTLQMEKVEVDNKFWVNVKEREEKGEKVILGESK
jgi:hypothetical protein